MFLQLGGMEPHSVDEFYLEGFLLMFQQVGSNGLVLVSKLVQTDSLQRSDLSI